MSNLGNLLNNIEVIHKRINTLLPIQKSYKYIDIENICNMVDIEKSFWHTNDTIFDVNLSYLGEGVGMVSFSKNNQDGQYWEPHMFDDKDHHFFNSWKPKSSDAIDNFDKYVNQMEEFTELKDCLIKKAKIEFDRQHKWN